MLRSMGFSAIAPQGEANEWDEALVRQLKRRFSNIVILYDNDEAGRKGSRRAAASFGCKEVFLLKSKDVSDHVLKWGHKNTVQCLKKYLGRSLTRP